jgi:N-acyl amino acid synthase of PEP-CTERM/exosortase system
VTPPLRPFGGHLWTVKRLESEAERRPIQGLRYRVYCEEKKFLPAEDYPDGLERDEFDPYSVHFGTFSQDDEIVGTVRLVRPGPLGFPLMGHCTIDPEARVYVEGLASVAEISRLAVNPNFRRRRTDTEYGIELEGDRAEARFNRMYRQSVVVSLYRAIYQHCRRNDITHLLAAMEMGLRRLLQQFHFPFTVIGPEVDYFGPVVPFVLDLDELDKVLAVNAPDLLREFHRGLYPAKEEAAAA